METLEQDMVDSSEWPSTVNYRRIHKGNNRRLHEKMVGIVRNAVGEFAAQLKEIGIDGKAVKVIDGFNDYWCHDHAPAKIIIGGAERYMFFTITQLPGCCGVAVITCSTGTSLTLAIAEDVAKKLGYTCVLNTNLSGGLHDKLSQEQGYKRGLEFINGRTGHMLYIDVKDLNPK